MADRGFPSMTALLGLLAIAGYQNRDKLAEMLSGSSNSPGRSDLGTGQQGSGGRLGGLLGNLGAAGGIGGLLGGGLNELMESFRQHGQGDVAESWVGTGPNK